MTRLIRRQGVSQPHQIGWVPETGEIDTDRLPNLDAVVHLAGENISAGRWTANRKHTLRSSRGPATRLLTATLAKLDNRPRVFAGASAFGYYGNRADEILTEHSSSGNDFLADVTREWEEATTPASDAGIRVVNMRFGLVFDGQGGALPRMARPFKLGFGGKIAAGKQYMSWITLGDTLRAILHILNNESLTGPLNVSAPGAVTNAEFTKTIARVLSRPSLFPVPGFGLKIMFGELADSILASARMDPTKLVSSGFEFHHPDLESALRSIFGKK